MEAVSIAHRDSTVESREKIVSTRLRSFILITRDGRFGSKVGQIGPKWDKSGAFSDQISVHLAPLRQMH